MDSYKIGTLIDCGLIMIITGWGIMMVACALRSTVLFFIGASVWGIGLTTVIIALISMAKTKLKKKKKKE